MRKATFADLEVVQRCTHFTMFNPPRWPVGEEQPEPRIQYLLTVGNVFHELSFGKRLDWIKQDAPAGSTIEIHPDKIVVKPPTEKPRG